MPATIFNTPSPAQKARKSTDVTRQPIHALSKQVIPRSAQIGPWLAPRIKKCDDDDEKHPHPERVHRFDLG